MRKNMCLRRIFFACVLVAIGMMSFLFSSCQAEDETIYSGQAGLYFALDEATQELDYSFITTTNNYIVVNLPIETLGLPVSSDRTYSVDVVNEATTAKESEDYDSLQTSYVVKADSVKSAVVFRLLYTPKLDSTTVKLKLSIRQTDAFPQVIEKKKTVLLTWTNDLVEPSNWNYYYKGYFGVYSKVKHRLILAVLGITELPEPTSNMAYQAVVMNNYFTDHIVYDENGKRIEPWLN